VPFAAAHDGSNCRLLSSRHQGIDTNEIILARNNCVLQACNKHGDIRVIGAANSVSLLALISSHFYHL